MTELTSEARDGGMSYLLIPDVLLPEQWVGRRPMPLTGERALQWAVLTDAIASYRECASAAAPAKMREFHRVRRWVTRDDWQWPYSFVNLCLAFDFEPSAVRTALRRYERSEPRKERRRRYRQAA